MQQASRRTGRGSPIALRISADHGRRSFMPHLCPVCGYPDLKGPPRGPSGGGSYEICASCRFQFGVTDDDRKIPYADWREAWISRGMPWAGIGILPPAHWDPKRQLQAAHLETDPGRTWSQTLAAART